MMVDWTKVLKDPYVWPAYALFCVLTAIPFVKKDNERRWFLPFFLVFAALVMTFGLWFAWHREARLESHPAGQAPGFNAPNVQSNHVNQSTTGAGSPAIQGVQGPVTITEDQSLGTSDKEPAKKSLRKKK